MTLRLAKAAIHHLEPIEALIDETARWLGTKGTDQWAKPWPTRQGRRARIQEGLEQQTTWLLWKEGTQAPVGTITVERQGDPRLWTPGELAESATYVHRLIVRRAPESKGLGSELLRWVVQEADTHRDRFIRIDVWTTNLALRDYYLKQDFEFMRISERENYPSGALFQRPVLPEVGEKPLPFVVAPTPGDG